MWSTPVAAKSVRDREDDGVDEVGSHNFYTTARQLHVCRRGTVGAAEHPRAPPVQASLGAPPVVVGLIAGGQTALTRAVEGAEDDPRAEHADVTATASGPATTSS